MGHGRASMSSTKINKLACLGKLHVDDLPLPFGDQFLESNHLAFVHPGGIKKPKPS